MFGTIYKLLPAVQVAWRDVLVGTLVTAALFSVGKALIGIYLGRSGVESAYGAAGSLILLLLWIYYSAIIFLLGAQITHSYAQHRSALPTRPRALGAQAVPARPRARARGRGVQPERL
jgi:membrane protein